MSQPASRRYRQSGIVFNIKRLLKRRLPPSIVHRIKKYRYAKAILGGGDVYRHPGGYIISKLVSPGDTVLDLGANMGFYTMMFSTLVGREGRVISFEPVPGTFDILRHVVGKFPLQNVELINAAASDRQGIVSMEIPDDAFGQENPYEASIVSGAQRNSRNSVMTPALTVDSVLAGRTAPITFYKCDVEGHELFVLLGSEKTLLASHPACMIEVAGSPAPGSSAEQVFQTLRSWGYRLFCLDDKTLVEVASPRNPDLKSVDYFCLANFHLSRLEEAGVTIDSNGLLLHE